MPRCIQSSCLAPWLPPRGFPVELKEERNARVLPVGKTAISLVSPRPQQPRHPAGLDSSLNEGGPPCSSPVNAGLSGSDGGLCEPAFLNISLHVRLICSVHGYPTERVASTSRQRSDRHWLLELPVHKELERNRPAVVTSQFLGEPASALLCSCFDVRGETLAQTAPLSRATNLHKSKPCAACGFVSQRL